MESALAKLRNLREQPEVNGIKWHYQSANWFLQKGIETSDRVECFRLHIAGIYFARAIIEIMCEVLKKHGEKVDDFEHALEKKLQFSRLVKRIRIHDFHRFGCHLPQEDVQTIFFGGPIRLESQGSVAALLLTPDGLVTKTENYEKNITQRRPLLQNNDKFWDETTQQYHSLQEILTGFLANMPEVVDEFVKTRFPPTRE